MAFKVYLSTPIFCHQLALYGQHFHSPQAWHFLLWLSYSAHIVSLQCSFCPFVLLWRQSLFQTQFKCHLPRKPSSIILIELVNSGFTFDCIMMTLLTCLTSLLVRAEGYFTVLSTYLQYNLVNIRICVLRFQWINGMHLPQVPGTLTWFFP